MVHCNSQQHTEQGKQLQDIGYIAYGVISFSTRFAMQFVTCHTVGGMTRVRIAGLLGDFNPPSHS
jgi:hypothetical protein